VCQWSPLARGSSTWVVLACDLGTRYKSDTKRKQYRLSYSTVTIAELAAFGLLNMLVSLLKTR